MKYLFLLFFTVFTYCFALNIKSIFTYTFNPNEKYDYQSAKNIYFEKKCNQCHGDNGEKKVTNSKIIRNMSPQDLKAALINYTLDIEHKRNTSTRFQMSQYAKNLSHDQMNLIIAYLKGDDFASELQIEELKKEEPEIKTKYDTFIK